MLPRRLLFALVTGALLSFAPLSAATAQEKPVTIFAAASLKNALDAAMAAYQAQTGMAVTISYAASSALAKQIEAGAPADLFISADQDWMDHVAKAGLIRADSRVTLLGNRLVLVARAGRPAGDITRLPALLGTGGRLAMADTAGVPAGKYGKAALIHLGLWERLSARVAQAENVRAALALVARGEAPAGIVYASDARAEPAVTIIATFPADSHPPIEYPAALLTNATPPAGRLLEFLCSAAASGHFETQGFTVLVK